MNKISLAFSLFFMSCVANTGATPGSDAGPTGPTGTEEAQTTNYLQKWNGAALTDSTAKDTGGTLSIAENMSVATGTGQVALFSTYRGANSDGNNIFIGGGGQSSVGGTPTSLGADNVSLGIGAMNGNTTGNASVVIGTFADYTGTSVSGVVAIGWEAMMASTTSSDDVAIGAAAMADTTTGFDNVAIGRSAMQACTTCMRNVAMGSNALASITVSEQNVAIGLNALEDFVGTGDSTFANTAVGYQALQDLVNATGDTAVGREALWVATGGYNTGIGIGAGQTITTGDSNTAIGEGAGVGITTGRANTILGPVTGLAATTSNKVILADGDGNVRITVPSTGCLQIANGATEWCRGSGAPAISCAIGDLYSRTDGGALTSLYVCTASNTWTGK